MRKLVICFLFAFCIHPVSGQKKTEESLKAYYQDSLILKTTFTQGKNVSNLTIKVINPCNPAKEKFDGAVTMIEAVLKYKKRSDTVRYNYPDAQSGLINFNKKNLSFYKIKGQQAIIIPFSYCGNFDNDTRISYLLFYDQKKYLYHINYRCGEDFKCKVNDDLDVKLKDLPVALKAKFIEDLKLKFKNAEDF